MPPILVAFFIAVGLATIPPTLKGLTQGVDPNVKHIYRAEPRTFRVWTAPRHDAVTEGVTCNVRFYALVTGLDPVRMVSNNTEELLDTAWHWDVEVQANTRLTKRFLFIDPVTRELLADVRRSFSCYGRVE
jgi:hypothetical protein